MKALAEKMVCSLGTKIRSNTFLEEQRTETKWFSRNRMLTFTSCVSMILARMVTCLRNELDTFFENILGMDQSVTPQAFSKTRRNIRAEAFVELFEDTREKIVGANAIRRFRGYRLFGIDGTDIQLPASEELCTAYPAANPVTPKSTRARGSVLCDVLGGFILDARLEPQSVGERTLAQEHLKIYRQFAKPRDIFLMDRGYPAKKLLFQLSKLPGKFLFRIPKSFEPAFCRRCNAPDSVTHLEYAGERVYVRVVRVALSSGETETLVTNLFGSAMAADDLRELYALRWGVETAYRNIKDRLSLIRFSGKSKQIILQDFFACMTFLNIACAFCAEADEKRSELDESQNLKYSYRANRCACFSFLKRHLDIMLLLAGRLMKLADRLRMRLIHTVCPVRPARSFERKPGRPGHRATEVRRPF